MTVLCAAVPVGVAPALAKKAAKPAKAAPKNPAKAAAAKAAAAALTGSTGANGNGAGAPVIANTRPLAGSPGGTGGAASNSSAGGKGGTGGIGALVTGPGVSSNTSTIVGGNGGLGGPGGPGSTKTTRKGTVVKPAGAQGNGGAGGAGLSFTGSGSTFINSGTVAGGNGAPGGKKAGVGGVGVTGANLTIINSGRISGGLSGDGKKRSDAVLFTSGKNTIELRSGYAFDGRVKDKTKKGTLILGGTVTSADTTINASQFAKGGIFSGFKTFTKSGTADWTLTGSSTSALPFTVTQGTLFLAGTFAKGTFTISNGTLGGSGSVKTVKVKGGTLSPGTKAAPTGTLNISKNLSFSKKSTYSVNVSPDGSSSLVNVGGTTKLKSAKVNVVLGKGDFSPDTTYTILTSKSVIKDTFSPIKDEYEFSKQTLSYDPNNVFLNVAVNYRVKGASANEDQVGSALNQAVLLRPTGNGGAIFTALDKVPTGGGAAILDSLSGEGITATQSTAHRSTGLFTSAIFDQTTIYGPNGGGNSIVLTDGGSHLRELADLPNRSYQPTAPATPNRTWRAWASGFGGVDDIRGGSAIGVASQNSSIYGGVIGIDYQLTPNYLVGVAVGGSDAAFTVAGRATTGSTTGGHVAFYDIATFGSYYGASSNSFSFFSNTTNRLAGGFGGQATETDRGSFDSDEFRTRLEFGRHIATLVGSVTPFIALELAELRSNGFNETPISGPGVFALSVNGQSTASVPSFIGFRFERVTPLSNGMVFTPILQAAYVHEFSPQRSEFNTFVYLPGSTFLVNGANAARDAAQVKAGGELAITPNSVIFANFNGEFAGVEQFYGGAGGFKYLW